MACEGHDRDSMHDRSVRGSYRRSGGEGEEPHRFQASGPKRIVDCAQSKDRAQVGGVNRPILVRLTVSRAARRIDGGKLRNREAWVQEVLVKQRVAEVGRTHPVRV